MGGGGIAKIFAGWGGPQEKNPVPTEIEQVLNVVTCMWNEWLTNYSHNDFQVG